MKGIKIKGRMKHRPDAPDNQMCYTGGSMCRFGAPLFGPGFVSTLFSLNGKATALQGCALREAVLWESGAV